MAGLHRVQDEAWNDPGTSIRYGEGLRPAAAVIQAVENGKPLAHHPTSSSVPISR
jgi:hypothetical protein